MSTSVDAKFEQAKDTINTLRNEPGNDVKLKIYALFKQVQKFYILLLCSRICLSYHIQKNIKSGNLGEMAT